MRSAPDRLRATVRKTADAEASYAFLQYVGDEVGIEFVRFVVKVEPILARNLVEQLSMEALIDAEKIPPLRNHWVLCRRASASQRADT